MNSDNNSAILDCKVNMYYYYSLDCKVFYCFHRPARLGCRPSVFSTVGSHLDCKVNMVKSAHNSDFLEYNLANFEQNFPELD